ncbi:MAG: hypothetical protein B7X91_11385 [Hydrogenophilales bacterium 17-64-11]|nr:MAG: hypothetical protein B7X91_11385 [Hydrogenophilales bacterium 17-64-11]
MKTLERFGSLGNWDAPASMKSFEDVDFTPNDKWQEAESLSRKDPLISILGVVQAFLMASLIASLWLASKSANSLHFFLVSVFLMYLCMLFVYAVIASRADDLVTARRSGFHTLFRAARAFLWQWPFFFQFRFSVAAFLWAVMPLRIHATLVEWEHKNESLMLMGRFWHYGLTFCGAVRFAPGDRPLNELSKLAVNRRTDLFDCAFNPKSYFILGASVFLAIVSIIIVKLFFDDRGIVAYSPIAIFLTGIVIYKMKSLRSEITGMVWFPMLYRRMQTNPEENEPELPPLGDDKANLRINMFLRAATQMLVTPLMWVLIYWAAGR